MLNELLYRLRLLHCLMLLLFNRLQLLSLLCFLLIGTTTWAQKPAPKKAKLNDCYRVVGKDSVVFFYSADYILTPPGCATIRRHVRLDSAGKFFGYVRDFRLDNNQPVLRGAYRSGRKEGLFEVYHTTGELAARGHYRQGRQVGDWAYWYPSGSRRQVLSFQGGQDPLIQQFWDETGKQLVVNGNGTWQREEFGLRLRGAVVNGIPDGRWQLRRIQDESPVAREIFAKGHFRSGVLFNNMESYQDESRIFIADWEDYSHAEEYEIGEVCPPVPALAK